MISLSQTLEVQQDLASHKVHSLKRPVRYFVASMLAGAYVGIAVVLMLSTAGPLAESGDPMMKLVAGGVFAVALVLVVFAGAELVTSAMMILTQGALSRTITWQQGLLAGTVCFIGNLAGAMLFAGLVTLSGVLRYNAAAGTYLATMLESKAHATGVELFFRAILCNILVCLAIWAANRCESEIGKLTVIFWCLLAFVASGYEHVVANMTTFSLGLFAEPSATTWADFGRNMGLVGLGNLVGGALFVGVAYWFLTHEDKDVRKEVEPLG